MTNVATSAPVISWKNTNQTGVTSRAGTAVPTLRSTVRGNRAAGGGAAAALDLISAGALRKLNFHCDTGPAPAPSPRHKITGVTFKCHEPPVGVDGRVAA